MNARFSIHPAIGIARVGNATDFYLAPFSPGGLPIECTAGGDALLTRDREPLFVRRFKTNGSVRPQAARFSVYRYDEETDTRHEVTLGNGGVESITWTVHLANKKACWYVFSERDGDLMRGERNSYRHKGTPLRNKPVKHRRTLIIDPGPRKLSGPSQHTTFSAADVPVEYAHARFPPQAAVGRTVSTLGDVRTDADGRLLIVGPRGDAGGSNDIQASLENDGWFDDIGDGPVVCEIRLAGDSQVYVLRAWCIIAPPKFAPQLLNPVTLDDLMLDVAAKYLGLLSSTADGASNTLTVSFDRDVEPILTRLPHITWVSDLRASGVMAPIRFNVREEGEENQRNRERFVALFRHDPTTFFDANGVPLFPIQPSSDFGPTVRRSFLTLPDTQLRILRQWARGNFINGPAKQFRAVDSLDRAAVANCVGGPLDPGVEVCWSLANPKIYEAPWRILHRLDSDYARVGLDPDRDETEGGGCEPGDLTKRLTSPWQVDMANCADTPVTVGVSSGGVRGAPQFTVPWWPAQRPVWVTRGTEAPDPNDGMFPGAMVSWTRGNDVGGDSPATFVQNWSNFGFVLNENRVDGNDFPYFVEAERTPEPDISSEADNADHG